MYLIKIERSNVVSFFWHQSGLKILLSTLNKCSTGAEDAETLRTRFAITASIGYVLINALIMCFKQITYKICLDNLSDHNKVHYDILDCCSAILLVCDPLHITKPNRFTCIHVHTYSTCTINCASLS